MGIPRVPRRLFIRVPNKRTVVITGASSGIGRSSVSRMVQSGWRVFATVRKEQDGDQLRSDFGTIITPVSTRTLEPDICNCGCGTSCFAA